MSQSGILTIENSNPQIPTQFDTDSGSAIPVLHVLEILGTVGMSTSGSGNTVTVTGDLATAGATVGAATIGVSAFDSADFTVTDGFVQLSGTATGTNIETPDGDPPVEPDGDGTIQFTAGSGIEITGTGPGNAVNFSLSGGTTAVDAIAVQATSGGGTDPVLPDGSGQITIDGATVAAQSIPVRSISTAENQLQIEIQRAADSTGTDTTSQGICSFDDTQFSADANGYVTLVTPIVVADGGTGASTLTGVLTGNGTSAITASTVTQYGVILGGASNALASTAVGTSGQVLQSSGAGVNPAYSTATYPATTTAYGVLYSSATNVVGETTPVIDGVMISDHANGEPSFLANGTAGYVLTAQSGAPPAWASAGGSGDVSGPGSSTDNALSRWNGTGGDTLQDSTVIVTDNGEMTNASQPSFLAYLGSADNNVTGDGTTYSIGFNVILTEVFDQNGDFSPGVASTSAATFTAPVTGKYFHELCLDVDSVTSMTQSTAIIVASNGTYGIYSNNASAVQNLSGRASFGGSVLLDMDAADTCTYSLSGNGIGADTADLGTTSRRTRVSGFLAC